MTIKKDREFPGSPRLRLRVFSIVALRSITGQGTKILQAILHNLKKKRGGANRLYISFVLKIAYAKKFCDINHINFFWICLLKERK